MHQSSYDRMSEFARGVPTGARVADIGAYDVNGTYRALFTHCEYTGIDICAGPNVDRVVTPEDFGAGGFDAVISGQCMEHVENIYQWVDQIIGLARPGALMCVIVPNTCGEHRHPVDCWRVFPDGMRWLFRDCEIIACVSHGVDTVLQARRHAFDQRSREAIRRY